MFGFKKELYTPEYQLAGDECAVIETSALNSIAMCPVL